MKFRTSAIALAFLLGPAAFGQPEHKDDVVLHLTGKFVPIAQVPQAKSVIDVRDVPGVDCTGATASGAALSALSISGLTVSLARCSRIRIDGSAPWSIYGQSAFIVDGRSKYGSYSNTIGPMVFGCNGGSGAVIQVNRSGHGILRGFSVVANGSAQGWCGSAPASKFTESISIDNTGDRGVTGTDIEIERLQVTPSWDAKVPGYIGIHVLNPANLELMKFHDDDIECQNSPNSYGIKVDSFTSQNNDVHSNNFGSCMWGFWSHGPEFHLHHNNFAGTGNYTVFGGGASIYCHAGLQNYIGYNGAGEGSGQFFTSDTGCNAIFEGNGMGGTDVGALAPGTYIVELGTTTCNGSYVFKNRNVAGNQNSGVPIIGCSSYSPLLDFANGNLFDDGSNNWYTSPVYPPGIPQQGFTSPTLDSNKKIHVIQTVNRGSGSPFMLQSPSQTERASNFNASGSPTYKDITRAAVAQRNSDPVAWTITSLDGNGNSVLGEIATDLPFIGGFTTAALPLAAINPSNGTETPYVRATGGTGSTHWAYQLTCITGGGTFRTSSPTSISNGVATLGRSTYNSVHWYIQPGCVRYYLYRTTAGGRPNTTGRIWTLNVNTYADAGSNKNEQVIFNDTGLSGDVTSPPATNADGRINSPVPPYVNGSQISSSNLSDGPFTQIYKASLTTTSGTSDNVGITGITVSSHCSLTATNASAARNFASTYVSAKTRNQITVTHNGTSGMTYDILCTVN